MTNNGIIRVREAIYSMFPNTAYLTIDELTSTEKQVIGQITIHLLSGKIKIILVDYLIKEDKLEIKEK